MGRYSLPPDDYEIDKKFEMVRILGIDNIALVHFNKANLYNSIYLFIFFFREPWQTCSIIPVSNML